MVTLSMMSAKLREKFFIMVMVSSQGGATGVDYFAMDEALMLFPDASHLKVIIPTNLQNYIHDYRTNWCKDPVTPTAIDTLEELLTRLKSVRPEHFVEMPFNHDITQEHYDLRHNEEVAVSDAVYAFQVNKSTGTQDTIDKAKAAGLTITLHKQYTI